MTSPARASRGSYYTLVNNLITTACPDETTDAVVAQALEVVAAVGQRQGRRIPVPDGLDLTGVHLEGAILEGIDLSGVQLRDARLNLADLANADLTRADLKDANLTGADLTGANLTNADLEGADLTRAKVTDVDISAVRWPTGGSAVPGTPDRSLPRVFQHPNEEVLEGLATAVNHRRWFVELAMPFLGDDPIEVGSGLGDYAIEWADRIPRFTASEADPERLVRLKERMVDHPSVSVRELVLPSEEHGQFSAAVSYNVLEHIDDHVGALRSIARLIRPGGAIVLIVPAFMFAMSPVDIATGHVRRYTKKTMRAALTDAGLQIERLHYANALGLIGYYAATSIFKLTPKEGGMVKVYDRLVLPVTKAAESVVKPPFGQSVFAVARVPR